METKKFCNTLINFILVVILICVALSCSSSKVSEGFGPVINYFFPESECEDCEECVYDPKVSELKQIVHDWFVSREAPWTGHLEPLNQIQGSVMNQIKLCRGTESYTIDKKFMWLCVKEPGTDTYYDDATLMHVLLHEISHVICDEIGHTVKFDNIFDQLMSEASSELGELPGDPAQRKIYDLETTIPGNYCGLNPTETYDVQLEQAAWESEQNSTP